MTFDFDPVWPLPLVLLAITGLLTLVLTTYPQRVKHLRTRDRRLLIGLRLATVAVLAIAMLRPVVKIQKTDQETRTLFIVADRSRSMGVSDGTGPIGDNTRRQELLRAIKEAEEALEELGEDVEIRYFDFAESFTAVDGLEDETDGQESNIAAALKALLRLTDGKKMLGVVLMSDGAVRVYENAAGQNPRQQAITAAGDFGERRIKINTVGLGGATANSAADLAVVDMSVDANPYEGKVVTVNVTFRAVGAKGQRLTARLLVEDRAGAIPGMNGTMVEAKPIKTSKPRDNNIIAAGAEDVITRELTFVPTRPGKIKVAVEISGLQNERNTANNVITRIIDVRSGGISVAYFDRIRPEQRWLRKVNASDKIQLDYYPVLPGRTRIDAKLFGEGENAYDVFLIGDVPAATFGAANLVALRKRIDDGAGLMMIGGYSSFGSGGYANSPLAAVLPVAMTTAETNFPPGDARSHYTTPLRMIPTDQGLRHFVMRIALDGKHRALWEKLVPLEGANKLKRKSIGGGEDLVKVLATTPDGTPLLLAVEWGGLRKPGKQSRSARVMAFGADTTYQWYLNGQPDAHQRFWRQVILYLAQKEENEAPVWVRIDRAGKRNFTPKDRIPIQFGARDQNGKPLHNLDYEIEILGPLKADDPAQRHTYTLQHAGSSGDNIRELVPNPVPGEYWIRVTGKQKDVNKTVHGTGWERFLVETIDLELDNPASDRKLLQSLAEQSGGTYVAQSSEFKDFISRLTMPEDDLLGTETVSLWDTWPRFDEDGDSYIPGLLLLFVLLMSIEWFIRKRRGLV